MEKIMITISKFSAFIVALAFLPFVFAYFIGLFLGVTDYWLVVKICRLVILALIIIVPMLVQHWRENQRFFIKWVGFLLLYVVITTFLWVKGF